MWIWTFLETLWFGPHKFSCLFSWSYGPDLLSITAVLFLISDLWGLRYYWVFQLCFTPTPEKSLNWAFLSSFQHKCSIEKAELLTEISSSLELVLLEWSCNMQLLEWLNKWSLELRRYFSAVRALSSLCTLRYAVTQTWDWPPGSSQGLQCMTFSIKEKREDLSVHTCRIYLQQTTEIWRIQSLPPRHHEFSNYLTLWQATKGQLKQ